VEMMLDATQEYDKPLSKERLYGWHAAMFPTGRSGMSKITAGAWRDDKSGPMQVISGPIGRERVHYQAPAAAKLDKEMDAFLDWFESEQSIDPHTSGCLCGKQRLRSTCQYPRERRGGFSGHSRQRGTDAK
jgi:Fic family protein